MPEIDLTQSEADALIAMEKRRADSGEYDFPELGGAVSIPLVSPDRRENFLLDLSRGRIDLAKVKFQNRARQVVILVRLELSGPAHRNPDGQEVSCPHLHLYREGFGDKWAFPVPREAFDDLSEIWRTLEDFMRYCNITEPPAIRRGLFT
jgi:hypothetical protein